MSMMNSLEAMMLLSSMVVVCCMIIICLKFIRYFQNKIRMMSSQQDNMRNIGILEVKIPEIKLKNKGYSLDENIMFIYDDESVSFLMGLEDLFEKRDNI